MSETYWGKNKGRSMEGTLVKVTRILGVLFFVLALVLNLKFNHDTLALQGCHL